MERVDSFSHPIIRNRILQVAFAPAANLLMVGGADGFIRVFDHRTGKIMHHVEHAESKRLFVPIRLPSSNSLVQAGSEVRTVTVRFQQRCVWEFTNR